MLMRSLICLFSALLAGEVLNLLCTTTELYLHSKRRKRWFCVENIEKFFIQGSVIETNPEQEETIKEV